MIVLLTTGVIVKKRIQVRLIYIRRGFFSICSLKNKSFFAYFVHRIALVRSKTHSRFVPPSKDMRII